MATMVLTTVGGLVGGKIGGAIGAVVGLSVDRAIFGPKARHGPRLGDLSIQTSSYGSQVPKIFGTMRVAGTVIWATDLIETKTKSGGGKGRPKAVGYSYAASFAVALSARNVRAVHRIWADGKLLRGSAGDFKTPVGGFRLHAGDQDQPADPLIAAAEGLDAAPGYRGLAYAVFEELQLEAYGNRIPSLSFEIEADPAPVPIGRIASELSAGAIGEGATPSVAGYAASGDSVRSAIEALADVVPLILAETGSGLTLGPPSAGTYLVPRRACSKAAETARRAAATVPGEVALTYYDPALDHQAGLQRAYREGPSSRADARGLAAAVGADDAKQFAEERLAALWAARSTAKLTLGWRALALRPGCAVRLEGEPGRWLIERWLLGPMTLALELVRLPGEGPVLAVATPGRAVSEEDLVHGPTALRLLDLPLPGEGESAWLAALASGASPGWRRALLTASFDGGASWDDLGPTAEAATMGIALTALGAGTAALFDDVASVDVEVLHAGMMLEGRSDAALVGGANLAAIGSELIQFGRAEQIGERRYRLSRFLRGRRGTEWASGQHAAGEAFSLIAPGSVVPIPVPPGGVGSEARLVAVGVGDSSEGATAISQVTGETVRPPAPVHLEAKRELNGDLMIRWVRRSRLGWTWTGGSDVPLGEERELYRVAVTSATTTRLFETGDPWLLYSAAQQLADAIGGEALTIAVSQIGTRGMSRDANIALV